MVLYTIGFNTIFLKKKAAPFFKGQQVGVKQQIESV
jgi:hypothetical protein